MKSILPVLLPILFVLLGVLVVRSLFRLAFDVIKLLPMAFILFPLVSTSQLSEEVNVA